MKLVLSLIPLVITLATTHASAQATLTVTVTADNAGLPPAGSLRERYAAAAAGDTLVFDAALNGQTIELSAPLIMGKSINIDATALSNGIVLSGRHITRGILIGSGTTVTLTGFSIKYGYTTVGGGAIDNSGTLTLDRMTLSDSISAGGNNAGCGGGICNQATGTLTITNSSIINNLSFFVGGGVGALDGGTLTINNSLIAFNQSGNTGGGIGIRTVATNANTTLTNVTIAENQGGLDGNSSVDGVGFVKSGAATNTATVRNCTVAYNTGSNFGIVTTGTMTMGNTIAWGNSVTDVGSASGGTATSSGGNFLGTQSGFTTLPSDTQGTNPAMAPLGNYGGPTMTYALLPGSVAINNGVAGGAPAIDQRGVTRTLVDSGAFESRGFTFTLSGNNQNALVSSAYGLPLGVQVGASNGEPVAGGSVIFTPPGSGARVTSGTTVLTLDASGKASQVVAANDVAGAFAVGVSSNGAGAASFSLQNLIAVSFTPVTLANAVAGAFYSQTLAGTGGTAPYTYAVTSGTLPAGLSLTREGTLSGTPTTAGASLFTITANDSSVNAGPFSASRVYTLTVDCPSIALVDLPPGVVGSSYTANLIATPASAYAWSITAGTLPSGLTLGPSGLLSGTPAQPGTSDFTLQAGAFACTGTKDYTLTMACPNCVIDGQCVAPGARDPSNDCDVCNPFAESDAYSHREAGVTCADDGLAHTEDRCDGQGACVHLPFGGCVIDGIRYLGGEAHPSNPCLVCDAALDPAAWSPRPNGTPCPSDSDECTLDACDAGVCAHNAASCGAGSGAAAPTHPGEVSTTEEGPNETPARGGCRTTGEASFGVALAIAAWLLARRKALGVPQKSDRDWSER